MIINDTTKRAKVARLEKRQAASLCATRRSASTQVAKGGLAAQLRQRAQDRKSGALGGAQYRKVRR